MRTRDHGFSLIELLIVVVVLGILTSIVVPQLIDAYGRSKQRASIADMRSIAVANATYRVDFRSYATAFSDLVPLFLNPVPPDDAWGNAWGYESPSDSSYTLTSYGLDGSSGPAAPMPWVAEPYEADLVVTNGAFTQVPDQNQ
ncbi:MAG: prepilin-type N-terminal cleavage/methylation domain-containing protein [Acidobacteria bacterium]|nr:prepilin-type N-terminal cleavage/methylation domain-containing protein [Acidobacteriota bacterium]